MSNNSNLLLLSLLLTVFAYGAAILVPVYLQRVIDGISVDSRQVDFRQLITGFGGLLLIYSVFFYIRNRVNVALEVSMSDNVNKKTMYHLFRIPYAFFDNRSPGNVLYRLGILDYLRDVITSNFVGAIIDVTCMLCVFIYIVAMFHFLSWPIVALLLIIGIYTLLITQKTIKLQKTEMSANEAVSDLRTEIINNMFQIKCLHLERYFWSSFINKFDSFQNSFSKEKKYTSLVSLGYSIVSVFSPIILIIYCLAFHSEAITSGKIILIYSLLGMLTNCAYGFFGQFSTLAQIKSIVFYLNDMLDEPELINDGHTVIPDFHKLEMNNISFRYNGKSKNVIKDLNLTVLRGEKIGIVGLTGSGKTTIVKLLTGLYKPNNGAIRINNTDLTDIDIQNVTNLISVVPQLPIVFNKSIRDNITLGDTSISDEKILSALNSSCFLDDMLKMPLGLDTYISGQGGNLSGGQIQRLALTRALVRSPQILVLDEATSSLDASTENKIYINLKSLEITTIVISHRLSTVSDSDCLYFIEEDNPIISGQHEWLLANSNSYKDLFAQQPLTFNNYSVTNDNNEVFY